MNETIEQYTIIRSARRKTAAIQVDEKGVSIRVPEWVTDQWIEAWISKKQGWISQKQAVMSQNLKTFCLKTEKGALFPFLGNEYVLDWCHGDRWGVVFEGAKLLVVMGKRRSNTKSDSERVEAFLKKWFKEQAEQVIAERVKHWADKKNVKYNSLKCKSFKRRWGSCSAQGEITFNWRLVFADKNIIDYVVIHELSHLTHLNHSPKFWALVERHCPDWKEKRSYLQSKNAWVLW
ncbi:M48 family metallopeptidase [Neptuniibacter sp. QD72_48]|uniref:M48 family metallopeptidase n=1 Tax=unclassified Neptuniibacter TaxID=2630693 RepID=UPI0039F62368